jgi:protein-disulfide isomerase
MRTCLRRSSQKALEDGDLRRYAAQLGLELGAFDRDRTRSIVLERIQRDVDSGLASGQVLGTPTLFIDGVVYRRGYDPPTLLRRWRHQADEKPSRLLTMIEVTRPG